MIKCQSCAFHTATKCRIFGGDINKGRLLYCGAYEPEVVKKEVKKDKIVMPASARC